MIFLSDNLDTVRVSTSGVELLWRVTRRVFRQWKKKIETVIHLEFGMNNLFVRFFSFFFFFKFKYNPSCDEFWSRPRHPTFLLNRINLDPNFGSFSGKWRISKSRISNCPFLNLWSSFQPCEVATCDIIELRQRWCASKSSSFNASISVWYQAKHLNNTHKKLVKSQNWITCALLGITKSTAFLVWKQRECYNVFKVLFMQRVLRLGYLNL